MYTSMQSMSIDEAKAQQWIHEVNSEIELVEELLRKVNQVSTTSVVADDTIMQGIYNTCNILQESWNRMCDRVKKSTGIIQSAIKLVAPAVQEVIENLDKVKGKI